MEDLFSHKLEKPFLILKTPEAGYRYYSGIKKLDKEELTKTHSYFGGITFEGSPCFFQTDECFQITNNLKQTNPFFNSTTLHLESIDPVESFSDFENMINESKNEFSNDRELLKIVLHRKIRVTFNRALTLSDLPDLFPNTKSLAFSFIFFDGYQIQISFTPETLVEITQNELTTMALAGTMPRGKTTSEDNELELKLLTDPKNLKEQQIVADHIIETLEPYCGGIKIEHKAVKKLEHVQHLLNQISGYLKENVSPYEVLKTLLPTPALGGKPKESALNIIRLIEKKPRQYYGGAIGYNLGKNSFFYVNIRNISFGLNDNHLHLYGGAGILPESDALSEWNETENKMRHFLNFFTKDN